MLYIALFGMSVASLLYYVFHSTISELESQIKHSVNIQLADLGRKFILDGSAETMAAINHLIEKDHNGSYIYLLISPTWTVMAGNLKRWPGGSPRSRDWIRFPLREPTPEKPNPPQAMAINSSLPGGYILMVGHNLRSVEKLEKTMYRIGMICLAASIFLGAVGGGILSLLINRRLEVINQACDRVMLGELTHRVRVTGANDEFDHLSKNFNNMLSRISELIDGIRDISSSVAHDLRTPLNRVRIRLEKLEHETALAEAQQQEVRGVLSEIDHLTDTFNAILRISQAEAGAGIEHFTSFNLSDAAEAVVELYTPLAEEKSIGVVVDIEPDIAFIGDKHLLSQAIANLMDNAIKYSPSGSRISVQLARQHDEVVLRVLDNGPGIPPEYHDKVLTKFYRMESSRNSPGNGLGLALVQAAASLHGAKIELADNQPGLLVQIRFPMV